MFLFTLYVIDIKSSDEFGLIRKNNIIIAYLANRDNLVQKLGLNSMIIVTTELIENTA
jgi:hypothetical protein